MSKLDEIEYTTYISSRPIDENGNVVVVTPETRQQIKDVFLGLIAELNDGDWNKPINSDELRQKVDTL